MMAKITKGSGFGDAVKYILDPKKDAELIGSDGVRYSSIEAITNDFELQSRLNPRVSKPVGHISLSFSEQDSAKLDNQKMLEMAVRYMHAMGIRDTQFIIGRHYDKKHPHIHILYNRVDYNGRTISDKNDRIRSTKICKVLTQQHNLHISKGKERVNRSRLRGKDAVKYAIYDAMCKHVPKSKSWAELQNRLRTEGIEICFKTKGSTTQVEGVRFTMNSLTFNGSKVDRQFSYSKIDFALNQNQRAEEQRVQYHTSPQHEQSLSEFSMGGLFDFTQNSAYDPEEEVFRRAMQRKKKKRGIKF